MFHLLSSPKDWYYIPVPPPPRKKYERFVCARFEVLRAVLLIIQVVLHMASGGDCTVTNISDYTAASI